MELPRRFLRVVIAAAATASVLSLSSCNISGFFTKQGDDPVWVDPNPPAEAKGGSDAPPGKALFTKNCAACHQATGKGIPGSIPPLAGSAIATGDDVTKPIRIVLHGFKGEIIRNGTKYNGQMQSWKTNFNDQEIAWILTYVRSSFGNTAGEVTADAVKEAREKTALRSSAYSEAELEQPM
ncbi:MAG: c-type cytochrome [Candidatus Kapaibacterium sp.]